MRNAHIERLEAKLKLWETPGFSQFLNDLSLYMDNREVFNLATSLKANYAKELRELEEQGKLKQTKLDL